MAAIAVDYNQEARDVDGDADPPSRGSVALRGRVSLRREPSARKARGEGLPSSSASLYSSLDEISFAPPTSI